MLCENCGIPAAECRADQATDGASDLRARFLCERRAKERALAEVTVLEGQAGVTEQRYYDTLDLLADAKKWRLRAMELQTEAAGLRKELAEAAKTLWWDGAVLVRKTENLSVIGKLRGSSETGWAYTTVEMDNWRSLPGAATFDEARAEVLRACGGSAPE